MADRLNIRRTIKTNLLLFASVGLILYGLIATWLDVSGARRSIERLRADAMAESKQIVQREVTAAQRFLDHHFGSQTNPPPAAVREALDFLETFHDADNAQLRVHKLVGEERLFDLLTPRVAGANPIPSRSEAGPMAILARAGGGFLSLDSPPRIAYVSALTPANWCLSAVLAAPDTDVAAAAVRGSALRRLWGRLLIGGLFFFAILGAVGQNSRAIAAHFARATPAATLLHDSSDGSLTRTSETDFLFLDQGKRLAAERAKRAAEAGAPKMEAVGRLASGVAHDFNNLLTTILGNAEFIARRHKGENRTADAARNIISAGTRAGRLTAQLLAMSRKGNLQVVDVDIHYMIDDIIRLLEHTLDKRITVRQELFAESPWVRGDPGQLQNALLNLAINARDAMANPELENPTLTFATRRLRIPSNVSDSIESNLRPGDYLEIRVADTGCGMDKSTRTHIFEPFFTTKAPGKGTGLGLASVYGCVESHLGGIDVQTEVGKGSAFRILLPAARCAISDDSDPSARQIPLGLGHILLIDHDEVSCRGFTVGLEALGYKATAFTDAEKALETYRARFDEFDLVLTDTITSDHKEPDLFDALKEINSGAKIFIITGHDESQDVAPLLQRGALGAFNRSLDLKQLSARVSQALSAAPASPRPADPVVRK